MTSIDIIESNKKPCKYCGKHISIKNMAVHVKRCKVKNDCNSSYETMQIITQLKSENTQLKLDLYAEKNAVKILNDKYDYLLHTILKLNNVNMITNVGAELGVIEKGTA